MTNIALFEYTNDAMDAGPVSGCDHLIKRWVLHLPVRGGRKLNMQISGLRSGMTDANKSHWMGYFIGAVLQVHTNGMRILYTVYHVVV